MLTFAAAARADNWDTYICVDNLFDAYYGTNSVTTGYVGSGNNYNTTYHFTIPGRAATDYFYVVADSDRLSDQGFIGVFSNTTVNRTVHTSNVLWQVFPAGAYSATNPAYPSPWPANTLPTQAQVNTAIAYATANNLWISPADPADEDNDGSVFGGMRTSIPVSANWIWHNTGLGPDPNNPLHGGFNHDEFLVFRLAGAVSLQPIFMTNSGPPGTFIDISGTGTPLNLTDDEEAVIFSPVGNPAFPAGTVVVANNGGLGYPSAPGQDEMDPNNAPIPSMSAFSGRQSAIVYWDDLKGETPPPGAAPRGGKNGNVFWKVSGTTLIVQWNDRSLAGLTDGRAANSVRLQAQIFGGVSIAPGAKYAQFLYADVNQAVPNGGASATIGFQSGISGFTDFQWSYNTPGAVSNGTVLTVMSPGGGGGPSNSVPAVSDAGLAALVLLFLMLGALVFRRSRRSVPIP